MIHFIAMIISIAFIIGALAIGTVSAAHVRRNRNELKREFGAVMSCDTARLKRRAVEADRQTDENLQTQGAAKMKRFTLSDITH